LARFYARTMTWDRSVLTNICDEELLGATLREDRLLVTLSPEYFGETLVDEGRAMMLLERGDILDLVGERIVGLALKAGLAHPGAVRSVQRVPMLMIYKFRGRARE
jgi:hypothetical protein